MSAERVEPVDETVTPTPEPTPAPEPVPELDPVVARAAAKQQAKKAKPKVLKAPPAPALVAKTKPAPEPEANPNRNIRVARLLVKNPTMSIKDLCRLGNVSEPTAKYCVIAFRSAVAVLVETRTGLPALEQLHRALDNA